MFLPVALLWSVCVEIPYSLMDFDILETPFTILSHGFSVRVLKSLTYVEGIGICRTLWGTCAETSYSKNIFYCRISSECVS